MVQIHQGGRSVFKSIRFEDIVWKLLLAIPSSVRLAVVAGDPAEAALFVIRVKVSFGVKLMPHRQPKDRVYTMISGSFYVGLGDSFDGEKVERYPAGSVIIVPGNSSQFHWGKSGEYVTR